MGRKITGKNNESNEISKEQRLYKSPESQVNYRSCEISESIAGSLSWNLKAVEKRGETIASTDENFRDFGWFLKWDEDFLWKRFFMKTWTKSASDSTRCRAWTAEVRELKVRMLRERERDRAVEAVDIHEMQEVPLENSEFRSRTTASTK